MKKNTNHGITDQRRSCFELAIFIASTMFGNPFAPRTTLQFSKIQCNWSSGDEVSAKVPTRVLSTPALETAMRRTRTLQDVKEPAGIGEPDLGVAMF